MVTTLHLLLPRICTLAGFSRIQGPFLYKSPLIGPVIMANFRQHATGGVLLSSAGAFISLSIFGMTLIQSATLFILGTLGSILPDVDCDTSRPVDILFGILGVLLPIVLLNLFFPDGTSMENMLCFVLLIYICVHHFISKVFFKLTKHRGIIHSVPMAIIAGECAFLIFSDSPLRQRIIYALALLAGFMTHLVMDEIWSVDLLGARIKKSFGSAIAFRSPSKTATALVYLMIIILGAAILFSLGGHSGNAADSDNPSPSVEKPI